MTKQFRKGEIVKTQEFLVVGRTSAGVHLTHLNGTFSIILPPTVLETTGKYEPHAFVVGERVIPLKLDGQPNAIGGTIKAIHGDHAWVLWDDGRGSSPAGSIWALNSITIEPSGKAPQAPAKKAEEHTPSTVRAFVRTSRRVHTNGNEIKG